MRMYQICIKSKHCRLCSNPWL